MLPLFLSFLKIGLFSFGGGYAMLPLIEEEIVRRHGWISHDVFVDVVAIAQITPGPIAINAATFVGYRVAGILGSVAATVAVVLCPLGLTIVLTRVAKRYASSLLVRGALDGLRPALVAMIAYSAVSAGKVAFTGLPTVLLGVAAFVPLLATKVHPLLVLAVAAAVGGLFLRG